MRVTTSRSWLKVVDLTEIGFLKDDTNTEVSNTADFLLDKKEECTARDLQGYRKRHFPQTIIPQKKFVPRPYNFLHITTQGQETCL